MNLIKLTRQNGTTEFGGPWEIGTYREIEEDKREPILCSPGVLHAYRSIELGLLLNPIMGDIQNPKAWAVTGDVVASDYAKVGCYSMTITGSVEIPAWYSDEAKRRDVQVMFAVLCAEAILPVYESKYPDDRPRKAVEAAKAYLRTKTEASADAAANAARGAYDIAYAAARDAAADAADAADAAAYAAYAAAYAYAVDADAARDAYDIGDPADTAAYAASRAARADWAANTSANLYSVDFEALARQAVAIIEAVS